MIKRFLFFLHFAAFLCIVAPTNSQELEENKIGNSAGNIVQYGILTQQGEWIYYNNFGDRKKLFKMKVDGTKKQKICDDNANHINVIGKTIYYSIDNGKMIISIGIDGRNRRKILRASSYIRNLLVDTKYIYYVDEKDYKIYRINFDGSGRKCISNFKSFGGVCIWENSLFTEAWHAEQRDSFGTVKMDMNTLQYETLLTQKISTIHVDDVWLFFTHEGKIGKMHISGEEKTVIKTKAKRVVSPVVCDEWIYFHDLRYSLNTGATLGYLYRIRTDGSQEQIIDYGQCSVINATKDYIFYSLYDDKNKKMIWYRMRSDLTGKQKVD